MKDLIIKIVTTNLKYYVGGAFVIVIAMIYMGFETTAIQVETSEVKNGEFIIDVVTVGEVKAHKSTIVTAPSNIRGSLQIVEIVPEGTQVKKGDFLLRFDIAALESDLIKREDDLSNYKLQREETVASQKAAMAQMEANFEIQKYNHEQAQIRYELMKFEPEIKQKQQKIDMMKAELNMQEVEEGIKQQKIRDVNSLRRTDYRISRMQDYADDLKEQIASATITAPSDGLVVYKKRHSSSGEEKIKVGDSVYRRMDLIEIPDLSLMQVETSVNEVDISKLRRGQEVIITLDAHEGDYYGTITKIARLARSEYGAATVKVFDLEVTINNSDESLKPGMSATCQVITDKMMDVTFVPIQSVFEEEGETFVYLADNGGYNKTTVKTEQKNSDFIIVSEGLEQGQFVALRDPYSALQELGTEIKDKPTSTRGKAVKANQGANPNMMRMMRGRH
ncbi:MAG: HlyD family efflux transporter periplasmic adaptor subunit [bacterium]|nr:HlyD family efflux transporter periplasmic adaptor subunit [bacterium]